MYCLDCHYRLVRCRTDESGAGVCPECGRGFDRSNPDTYLPEQPLQRIWRWLQNPPLLLAALLWLVILFMVLVNGLRD